ncbi:hypothetical protein ACFWNN_16195 [Lentzea sp. NPDC058450]|uniref:hypothetical protein n=1 Tax=Lentzea sp. NPDC058450 TaxID=3346505 RepID=UPI003662D5E1
MAAVAVIGDVGGHAELVRRAHEVFWPDPLPAEGIALLREWWRDGGCGWRRRSPVAARSSCSRTPG